jgi:hypothetical protein
MWPAIITILVAIIVFVLGSIVRAGQDEDEKRKKYKRSFEDPERRKRSSTDLDKFLEEARRRRQVQEQRRQPQVIMEPPAPPKPPPAPKRREVEAPIPQPQRRPKTQRPASQPRREKQKPAVVLEAIPVAVEVPRSMPAEVLARFPQAVTVVTEVAVPAPAPPPPPPPSARVAARSVTGVSVSGAKPSPIMPELAALLQTSDRLRAAIALQEILGPPRCRSKQGK